MITANHYEVAEAADFEAAQAAIVAADFVRYVKQVCPTNYSTLKEASILRALAFWAGAEAAASGDCVSAVIEGLREE